MRHYCASKKAKKGIFRVVRMALLAPKMRQICAKNGIIYN
jgi:hypothetical protein